MNRLLSPTVFQYAVFYTLKGGLLLCKMPSFARRKMAYWKTVDCQAGCAPAADGCFTCRGSAPNGPLCFDGAYGVLWLLGVMG